VPRITGKKLFHIQFKFKSLFHLFRHDPREDLPHILTDVLQVTQVVFFPVDPVDDIGHVDGMVRFVDEPTVVANDYSGIEVSRKFRTGFRI
jgi:agmatine deiminase